MKNKTKVFSKNVLTACKNSRIGIHPSFVFVAIFCAVFGNFFRLVILSALALLHECGHAVVAMRYGYKLKKIRLMPFGAQLSGEDLFLQCHEIKIALAGPITNIILCLLCVSCMWLFPCVYFLWDEIFFASLSLAVFNILPFFPLDGGRVFVAIASKKTGRKNALKISRISTFIFGICLVVLFVFSLFLSANISFAILGVSLICSSVLICKDAAYEHISSRSYKQKKLQTGIAIKSIAVFEDTSILSALSQIDSRMLTNFVVYNREMQVLFEILETELEECIVADCTIKKMNELKKKH